MPPKGKKNKQQQEKSSEADADPTQDSTESPKTIEESNFTNAYVKR
jgi:hypothetical protein